MTEADAGLPAAPVASEPAKEPYDLAKDLVARDVDAKKRLGKGIETAVVGDVFLLVGARGYTGPGFGA